MIASAVVIPEQEPEKRSPSPTLKRRQSSISSDTNKRPRLDIHTNLDNGPQNSNGSAMSPPNRRRSGLGVGAAEEKKRGQRLFGAVLGTLSQTSSKPAHKRRDEIEQKQRERLRKDTKDREEERRRKREELSKLRRVEQEAWDKESRRIRHRNMRAMAGFLQTKTEPRLYYKPWELLEEEEEQVKQQVSEVEETIRDELRKTGEEELIREMDIDDSRPDVDKQHQTDQKAAGRLEEKEPVEDEKMDDVMNDHDDQTNGNSEEVGGVNGDSREPTEPTQAEEEKHREDDHAGEELVEGQEDDVIY